MTEIFVKNAEIINDLVSKHFNVSKESLEKFILINSNVEEKKKYIPENIIPYLDEDLRYRVKIDSPEVFDEGWKLFKSIFREFIDKNNVNYTHFSNNTYFMENNNFKLTKAVRKWYSSIDRNYEMKKLFNRFRNNYATPFISDEDFEKKAGVDLLFKVINEKIGAAKVSKGDFELVISYNFADWFLVSSSETWSSCLNLDSDCEACYWSGLPGLIGDKSRSLMYLTQGKKKEYQNIIVDKMNSRSWLLLDKNDMIWPIRHYPQEILTGINLKNKLEEILDNNYTVRDCSIYDLNRHSDGYFAQTKYPIDPLYDNDNESLYIYQDGTEFTYINDEEEGVYLCGGSSGYHKFNRMGLFDEDTNYNFEHGLSTLIREGINITEAENSRYTCEHCGCGISEDQQYYGPDDYIYCGSCFNELFTSCFRCGESERNCDTYEGSDGNDYCESCFNEEFTLCEECDEVIRHSDVHSFEDRCLCVTCYCDVISEREEEREAV